MTSPQYEVFEDDEDAPAIHTGRIVPVYEKLGPLTGKALRRVLFHLVAAGPGHARGSAPARRCASASASSAAAEALRRIHVASPDDDLGALNRFRSPAHVRLILEELFLFQLGLARRRHGRCGASARAPPSRSPTATRDAVKRSCPSR